MNNNQDVNINNYNFICIITFTILLLCIFGLMTFLFIFTGVRSNLIVSNGFTIKETGEVLQLALEEPYILSRQTIIILALSLPTILYLFTVYVIHIGYIKESDKQRLYTRPIHCTYITLFIALGITVISLCYSQVQYSNALDDFNEHRPKLIDLVYK